MPKKKKMASQLSSHPTIFEGVKYGLEVIGKKDFTLKDEQLTILKIITVQKRDVLAVLPTGFGKSLVYQLIAPFADFMAIAHRPTVNESIVLVISPLNALIRDQVSKLKESGLKACILKGDRVALDEDGDEEHVSVSEPVENLKNFQVIFAHPEALVENKATLKILKTEEFQNRVRAIVVDEAHLVVDWYVHPFILYYISSYQYMAVIILTISGCFFWNVRFFFQKNYFIQFITVKFE